ncbi:hypothetical protein [Methylorubrum rhodesianum]|uniref:hypothetical protein n=1 Tax=Methylorubrum rhodesianum TaxID=29427 RepID=UPI0037458013
MARKILKRSATSSDRATSRLGRRSDIARRLAGRLTIASTIHFRPVVAGLAVRGFDRGEQETQHLPRLRQGQVDVRPLATALLVEPDLDEGLRA